ncbi:response regulator, partial [Photobacterium sanctipauli]
MNQVLFQREFILSYENLPSIRKMLDDKAPSLQISPDLLQSLKLVSSEYCANLLEHQQKPADTITISYGKHEGLFQYSITDNGTAWPQQQQRLAEASLPNEPCESGMGLALIKATFPEYHYTSHPEFNQITFSLPQQPRQNHLVIVDDNRSQLAILTSYLEQHYQLAVFSTAQDALRWLNTNHCDLVLTDLHMPGINGIDFRQQVAALAQHRLLPFVFISGDSVTETMSTAAQSGIDDFLTKPINKQHLLQVLARILKRHQHLTQAFEDNILQQLDYSPLVEGTISAAHCHPDVVIQLDQDPTFSGDFFVRHTLLDGSSLMILGDMMGHGLIAKANGGINLGMIQGILMDPAITPDQLCERLNQYLFLSKPNSLVCLLIVHYGLDHTAT